MSNLPTNYIQVLEDIKLTIKKSRFQAFKVVNSHLIFTYLELGKILLEQTKAGWGDGIIDSVSKDLQAEFYGVKGFSPRNLRRMKMLALELELQPEILPQAVAELPWGHTILLFEKVKEAKNRLFYINKLNKMAGLALLYKKILILIYTKKFQFKIILTKLLINKYF